MPVRLSRELQDSYMWLTGNDVHTISQWLCNLNYEGKKWRWNAGENNGIK